MSLELVSEEMYKPLGMTRSNFMTKVDFSDNVATGYATDRTTGELVPISPVLQRYVSYNRKNDSSQFASQQATNDHY
jgi:CubicO group peptidase (beta-lactamase class C family)